MTIHKVNLNISYQGRDCVATVNHDTEGLQEDDLLSLVDCCGEDCMPMLNTQEWYEVEREIDSAMDSFLSEFMSNTTNPDNESKNKYGEWI